MNSRQPSRVASPKKRELTKPAIDETELVEEESGSEPLQFQTLTKSSRNIGLVLEEQTHTEIAKQLTYHQDYKPSSIHTEAEQEHSPSHRLNQVSQTSASLVMFDAQNDN